MKPPKILEVTLRDGGYPIDFSFSSAETGIISKQLEDAGFEYVEVGHGLGLNASNIQGKKEASQTDEEYMKAANGVLAKAKWGMICIPQIAKVSDLDTARRHEMDFVRIANNVTEVESMEAYIKKAKENGMFVTANLMKSYAVEPAEFADKVKLAESYGAEAVYIVDSAGGMFPSDIKSYYNEIRKASEVPLGFHGHNNLGLAVANSLVAAEIGFDFVDCSLQGLGRSAGNTCTEFLIAALKKKGYKLPINLFKTLEIGEKYVEPLIETKDKMPLDVIAGYADFHTSYMGKILNCAKRYDIDPRILIIELTKKDKVDVDDKVLEETAKTINKGGYYFSKKYITGNLEEEPGYLKYVD